MATHKSNTIVVRVVGNTRGLSRSLVRASRDIGTISERINRGLTSALKYAAIAAAAFGAAAVAAGAVGAASLIAMTGAVVGLGVAFAAQSEKVKTAWSGLKDYVVKTMKGLAEPLVGPLAAGAGKVQEAFDKLVPTFKVLFKESVPLLNDFFKTLPDLASALGPMIRDSFRIGVPVLKAFYKGLEPVIDGFTGFFNALDSKTFANFTTALMEGIGNLLPPLGRLFDALTPLGTEILNILLPALGDLADYIADKVVPVAETMADWMKENTEKVKAIAAAVAGLVIAFKSMSVITSVIGLIGALLTPVGLVVAAVALLAGGFYYLWKNSETFRDVATTAWEAVKGVVTNFVENVWPKVQAAFDNVKAWWDENGPAIVQTVTETFQFMWEKAGPVVEQIKETVTAAFEAIGPVIEKFWTITKAVFDVIGPYILPLFKGVWDAVMSILKGAFQIIEGIFQVFQGLFTGDWKKLWEGIKNILKGAMSIVTGILKSAMAQGRAFIDAGIAAIKAIWRTGWNNVKTILSTVWNGIKAGVRTGIDGVMTLVRGIKGRVTGALSGAATWLLSAGRKVIDGFINGITAGFERVRSTLSNLTNLLPDWKGPASKDKKILYKAGNLIMEGLIKGIDDGTRDLKEQLRGVTRIIQGTDVGTVGGGGLAFAGSGGYGAAVVINVNVPPTADKASIGREIESALNEYYRVSGR